jgi:hypothetical protein
MKPEWTPYDNPPKADTPGHWSREVVALTNYKRVFKVAFFDGEYGGVWQTPFEMHHGESIEYWIDEPNKEVPHNG